MRSDEGVSSEDGTCGDGGVDDDDDDCPLIGFVSSSLVTLEKDWLIN